MVKLFDGAIGAEIRGFVLRHGPVHRLCSPSRSHLLIRDQSAEVSDQSAKESAAKESAARESAAEVSERPGHGDGSGLDPDSSLSSRARRAAALRSEMPSLR